jgi:hypothetical protein
VAGRVFAKTTAPATVRIIKTASDRRPAAPLSSRMVRASFGSAGAHAGRITLTIIT